MSFSLIPFLAAAALAAPPTVAPDAPPQNPNPNYPSAAHLEQQQHTHWSLYPGATEIADLGPWMIDYPGDYVDAARKSPPQWGSGPARLGVCAPNGAEIRIDGQKQPTAPNTKWLTFLTPPLAGNGDYHYKVSARWSQDGREVEDERNVAIHANGWASVDFTRPQRDHPAH